MTGSTQPPLLFLDVDGPLIPFGVGGAPQAYPTRVTGAESLEAGANPLLARIDPGHGPRLAALPCELVWATTWMADANECVSPRLGLPPLPVVIWPEPSDLDDQGQQDSQDVHGGPHWKTRTLVGVAGRPFAWVDDEVTGPDRAWVAANHRGPALLHRVDPRLGVQPSSAGLTKTRAHVGCTRSRCQAWLSRFQAPAPVRRVTGSGPPRSNASGTAV